MSYAMKMIAPRKAFVSLTLAAKPSRQMIVSPVAAATYKVTLVNKKNGKEDVIDVAEDDYIMDAADAKGINLPSSCRGGVCGSCVSKLLSGKVDDAELCDLDDGNVLTKDQMAAGFIVPCSVKPLSDLKIEYSPDWGVSMLVGTN